MSGLNEGLKMNPVEQFRMERKERIAANLGNRELQESGKAFLRESLKAQYSYNFSWQGRPIIQYPQDMLALQEIVWEVQPGCILEIGIAHGGSMLYSASLLDLLGQGGRVIAVDIDIRKHNRVEIEKHPQFRNVTMIEGSSIDEGIAAKAKELVGDAAPVLVSLDSNHTHAHVLRELELYAPLVSVGSYCIVYDGIIEDMPEGFYADRDWGPGNSPKTAVLEYLQSNPQFRIDEMMEAKLVVTAAPSGYLKRIS